MRNGEFCKIAIKVSGNGVRNAEQWKKAYLHVENNTLWLLSHVQSLHEAAHEGEVHMHGMRCVTKYLCCASDFDLSMLIDDDTANLHGCLVVFSTDPAIVASVHSRSNGSRRNMSSEATSEAQPQAVETPQATQTAQPSSPYVLPNYTQIMYEGQHVYHHSHNVTMNTPTDGYSGYRIGVELETEFAQANNRSQFTEQPRNWYFCEQDASLGGAGCEIITIPLIPQDAKNRQIWKPICKRLQQLGATSWDNNRCGLHVHIGREILGNTQDEREATLSRLLLFYNLYLNDDVTSNKVFGRASCYHEQKHQDTQELNAVKCLGASVLKDKEIAKRVGDALTRKQRGQRYYTINTTNERTIEFRKGRGSLSVDRIQTIITFCEAVCLYVKTKDDVSELSVEGFRDYIRANVPTTNSLYHYYDVVDEDC